MALRTYSRAFRLRVLPHQIRRCCSSESSVLESPEEVHASNDSREKPPSVMLKTLDRHIKTLPQLERSVLERFASKLSRRTATPGVLYCVDKGLAAEIADLVVGEGHGESDPNPVIEMRPGPCVLASAILDKGAPALRLYEDCPVFQPALQDLSFGYPAQRVEIFEDDLAVIAKRDYADHEDPSGQRVPNMLSGLVTVPGGWHGEPALKIIGTLANRKDMGFLRYVVSQYISRRTLFQFGRVKFVFCATPYIHKLLTSGPDSGFNVYRGSSILTQIFFDVKTIDSLPRESFFPWPALKSLKQVTSKTTGNDRLYLLTLEAREHLDGIEDHSLRELAFFVMYHLQSRKRAIIPALDHWIPGCGVHLIQKGFSIYSRFGDLTPVRLTELFAIFRSMPDYESCAFMEALNMSQDAVSFPFSLADVSGKRERAGSSPETSAQQVQGASGVHVEKSGVFDRYEFHGHDYDGDHADERRLD